MNNFWETRWGQAIQILILGIIFSTMITGILIAALWNCTC